MREAIPLQASQVRKDLLLCPNRRMVVVFDKIARLTNLETLYHQDHLHSVNPCGTLEHLDLKPGRLRADASWELFV